MSKSVLIASTRVVDTICDSDQEALEAVEHMHSIGDACAELCDPEFKVLRDRPLSSHVIFQHPENVQIPEKLDGSESNEDLTNLICEMDRRLKQLWDKVGFERQNKLIDYSKLYVDVQVIKFPVANRDCMETIRIDAKLFEDGLPNDDAVNLIIAAGKRVAKRGLGLDHDIDIITVTFGGINSTLVYRQGEWSYNPPELHD